MRLSAPFFLLPASVALFATVCGAQVETEYTLTHVCKRPSQRGDSINVHYLGTLQSTGDKFDASYDRGKPLTFTVGKGQVIKGWDEGLLDMCPGDKRKLTIPPEFGYGQRAMGPIPAGSTLIFETELVSIQGVEEEPKVVKEKEAAAEAAAGDQTEAEEPLEEAAAASEGDREGEADKDEL